MSMHPNRNLFAEFKKDAETFVETGSYRGDAIQLAAEAGYSNILSMDISQDNVHFCHDRFNLYSKKRVHNITVVRGDSATDLPVLLNRIKGRATFWLDSHIQMFEGEERGANPWPLLKELQHIKELYHRNHTIMIDDMLMLTHPQITGWTRGMIEDAVHRINRDYKIEYFANPVLNSILVAHV